MPETDDAQTAKATAPAAPKAKTSHAASSTERGNAEYWRERTSRFKGRHRRYGLAAVLKRLNEGETLTQAEVQERLDKYLARDEKTGGHR